MVFFISTKGNEAMETTRPWHVLTTEEALRQSRSGQEGLVEKAALTGESLPVEKHTAPLVKGAQLRAQHGASHDYDLSLAGLDPVLQSL